jgi:hypothetical protein
VGPSPTSLGPDPVKGLVFNWNSAQDWRKISACHGKESAISFLCGWKRDTRSEP